MALALEVRPHPADRAGPRRWVTWAFAPQSDIRLAASEAEHSNTRQAVLLERIQAMRQLLVRGMTQEEYLATVEILCPMAGNLERGEV